MMARRIAGELPVAFRYTPGVGTTAFFEALRDRGAFIGSRCDACEVTYVPSRIFCERCFAALQPGVEVGPEGTVESFTIAHIGVDGEHLEPPVTVGLVKLDGADTVVLHLLLGFGAEPDIGARVAPVPARERTGSMLDVLGFGPV
jgi:uncharacterized OB-fold protein